MERVSYDVPTPGALEGLLKSIYWKPAMRYVIDKVVVINPIKFTNIRRNEVKDKVSLAKMKNAMNGGSSDPTIYTKESITQRNSMILKDVKYAIEFHIEVTGIRCDKAGEGVGKHEDILSRRLKNGQFFSKPCLGCREFPVKKIELIDSLDTLFVSREVLGDVDLGMMIYRMQFNDGGIPVNNNWENPVFSNKATATYYHPHMINGLIDVDLYRRKCLW